MIGPLSATTQNNPNSNELTAANNQQPSRAVRFALSLFGKIQEVRNAFETTLNLVANLGSEIQGEVAEIEDRIKSSIRRLYTSQLDGARAPRLPDRVDIPV